MRWIHKHPHVHACTHTHAHVNMNQCIVWQMPDWALFPMATDWLWRLVFVIFSIMIAPICSNFHLSFTHHRYMCAVVFFFLKEVHNLYVCICPKSNENNYLMLPIRTAWGKWGKCYKSAPLYSTLITDKSAEEHGAVLDNQMCETSRNSLRNLRVRETVYQKAAVSSVHVSIGIKSSGMEWEDIKRVTVNANKRWRCLLTRLLWILTDFQIPDYDYD